MGYMKNEGDGGLGFTYRQCHLRFELLEQYHAHLVPFCEPSALELNSWEP
jgi:hypothetical protein